MTMQLGWDQTALLLLKLVRLIAYGQTAIVMVSFFSSLGWDDEKIGLFMSLTLFGDVLVSMLVGTVSHKGLISRRALLVISTLMLFGSGIAFALSSQYWVLLIAAVVGVISPSGDEVGPFMALESALIAHITPYENRAYLFGLQGMLGTFGLAVGLASGGWLAEVSFMEIDGSRLIFWGYSGWGIVALVLVLTLSSKTELEQDTPISPAQALDESLENETTPLIRAAEEEQEIAEPPNNSPDEQPALQDQQERMRSRAAEKSSLSFILCLIFGIDSLAYGFMPNSWLVEYMQRRYHAPPSAIGGFMFVSQFVSALTAVPSVWVTQLVGPVLAIGLTKFGAGLFGGIVPLAQNMNQSMGCILFRSLFDTMDVAPRQLFLTSVVPKEQTVAILSLVNVVKTFARSIAPIATGILAGKNLLWVAFVIMGSLEWVFGTAVIAMFS